MPSEWTGVAVHPPISRPISGKSHVRALMVTSTASLVNCVLMLESRARQLCHPNPSAPHNEQERCHDQAVMLNPGSLASQRQENDGNAAAPVVRASHRNG